MSAPFREGDLVDVGSGIAWRLSAEMAAMLNRQAARRRIIARPRYHPLSQLKDQNDG